MELAGVISLSAVSGDPIPFSPMLLLDASHRK